MRSLFMFAALSAVVRSSELDDFLEVEELDDVDFSRFLSASNQTTQEEETKTEETKPTEGNATETVTDKGNATETVTDKGNTTETVTDKGNTTTTGNSTTTEKTEEEKAAEELAKAEKELAAAKEGLAEAQKAVDAAKEAAAAEKKVLEELTAAFDALVANETSAVDALVNGDESAALDEALTWKNDTAPAVVQAIVKAKLGLDAAVTMVIAFASAPATLKEFTPAAIEKKGACDPPTVTGTDQVVTHIFQKLYTDYVIPKGLEAKLNGEDTVFWKNATTGVVDKSVISVFADLYFDVYSYVEGFYVCPTESSGKRNLASYTVDVPIKTETGAVKKDKIASGLGAETKSARVDATALAAARTALKAVVATNSASLADSTKFNAAIAAVETASQKAETASAASKAQETKVQAQATKVAAADAVVAQAETAQAAAQKAVDESQKAVDTKKQTATAAASSATGLGVSSLLAALFLIRLF